MTSRIATILGAMAVTAALAGAGSAAAQTMGLNSATFNGGSGRFNGSENHPVDPSVRDANGNLSIVDGIIRTGSVTSGSASASASASAGSFTGGVGASASASAIGNNLTVVTQGNFNTVIVNSTQINNGDVTAVANATGGAKKND